MVRNKRNLKSTGLPENSQKACFNGKNWFPKSIVDYWSFVALEKTNKQKKKNKDMHILGFCVSSQIVHL